jgi:hypothetical protein
VLSARWKMYGDTLKPTRPSSALKPRPIIEVSKLTLNSWKYLF